MILTATLGACDAVDIKPHPLKTNGLECHAEYGGLGTPESGHLGSPGAQAGFLEEVTLE